MAWMAETPWCLRSHRSRPLIGSCSPDLNGYRDLIAPALRGKHGGGCGAVDGTKSSEIEKYIKIRLFFSQYDSALGGRVPASDPGSGVVPRDAERPQDARGVPL